MGLLLLRCGCASGLPRPCMQMGHHDLYGMWVKLFSMISCSVGCFGIDVALALMACWLSSSSSSSCSLYDGFSSKFVDPVHCCECCGCGSVVHSSSMRLGRLPSKGLMIVILDGSKLSISGPSDVNSGQ